MWGWRQSGSAILCAVAIRNSTTRQTTLMPSTETIVALAERQLHDYDTQQPGTAFSEPLPLSIADAYRLQREIARLREERGEQVIGYKIGCTCRGNQQRHGLTHPVYGRLWSTEQFARDSTLSTEGFANVAVEGEFAVTLGHDIEPTGVSLSSVAAAVEQVFTVIELHNLVLRSADTGPELIANNAIHAGVIRSAGIEPPAGTVHTDLSLAFDGDAVGQWSGLRWPDDLLQALPWLVEELNQVGVQLRRGQTILTGAWGPPLPLQRDNPAAAAATRVDVASSAFGSVAASFRHGSG